jgi:hypothetical protein
MTRNVFIAGLMLALFSASALAENIDLVTLPPRDSVQLTIYNSVDLTLVKETRFITLKKGSNKLQFSWANTLIDPTSVELRPLEHAGEIEVLDTITHFYGMPIVTGGGPDIRVNAPQELVWNIESKFAGQVKVEISYFASGITWRMDYVAEVNADETTMKLRGYVRVFNFSGEEYENAQVRLVVGRINLVEEIVALARKRALTAPDTTVFDSDTIYLYNDANEVRTYMDTRSGIFFGNSIDSPSLAPKEVSKEALSEYFIFAIEGTETIKHGWSKRMVAVKADDVKFDIVYRMRAHQYGSQPVRFFIWKNDSEHKLGDSPLPDGLVRIFRDNGQGGLSFLGQQNVNYVPIKADIEVNLGPDDLVVYESWKMSEKRLNFHFHLDGRKEYVDGWDEEQQWTDTIHNYRTKPITFELQRVWNGDVEYHSETKTDLFDFHTIKTTFTVEARSKADYSATITMHNGENAKQNSIKLK